MRGLSDLEADVLCVLVAPGPPAAVNYATAAGQRIEQGCVALLDRGLARMELIWLGAEPASHVAATDLGRLAWRVHLAACTWAAP